MSTQVILTISALYVPVTSYLECKPLSFDDISLKTFVLVSFSFGNKQTSTKSFVAVVQNEIDDSREVNVIFMHPLSKDMMLFYAD